MDPIHSCWPRQANWKERLNHVGRRASRKTRCGAVSPTNRLELQTHIEVSDNLTGPVASMGHSPQPLYDLVQAFLYKRRGEIRRAPILQPVKIMR